MPSLQNLKKRIASVKNTQQTTKAMKMVSAAKLRKSQEMLGASRVYVSLLKKWMEEIATPDLKKSSGFFEKTEFPEKTCLLVMTADRGLCGAFHSGVIRSVQSWIARNPRKKLHFLCIGKNGFDAFEKQTVAGEKKVELFPLDFSLPLLKKQASSLFTLLKTGIQRQGFQEIIVFYNKFHNAAFQSVDIKTIFPLEEEKVSSDSAFFLPPQVVPEFKQVFDDLLEKYLFFQLREIFLESHTSEHGARMSAMENATKNAGEMIHDLTLEFNKQRQSYITKELLEIIAGSESQKELLA